jgi:hypothetical protein
MNAGLKRAMLLFGLILVGALATDAQGLPTCGISGDSSNHVPTDWATLTPRPRA